MQGGHCETWTFIAAFSLFYNNSRHTFQHLPCLSVTATARRTRGDWQPTSSSPTPLHWSLQLGWQRILAAKKTHAPDCVPPLMGKPFSAERCGKAARFLFQSHRGEQHILWQALGVSAKGICHGVFAVWVRFGPMRATERAARLLWKRVTEVPDNHAQSFLQKLLTFLFPGNMSFKPLWRNTEIGNVKRKARSRPRTAFQYFGAKEKCSGVGLRNETFYGTRLFFNNRAHLFEWGAFTGSGG